MLKIKDNDGRTLYVLGDEDEEPIPIDEYILNDKERKEKKNEQAKPDSGS